MSNPTQNPHLAQNPHFSFIMPIWVLNNYKKMMWQFIFGKYFVTLQIETRVKMGVNAL